jgi:short-subunit dehydrogenase
LRSSRPRVAVVVGASSGLGRAVALEFASRGTTLVLAAKDDDDLDSVGDECRGRGAQVIVVAVDVSDYRGVEHVASEAVATFGRIDVWVHLAAIAAFVPFHEVQLHDFRRVIDVNVMGYVHGARAALTVFRRQGRGVLVNVASIVSEVPAPSLTSYVTSKFAVLGFSKALRADLRGQRRIRVCTVLPGAMDTPMWRGTANGGQGAKPPAPLYSLERVARAVVRCAEHPRAEIAVGAAVKTLRVTHRVFPRATEWLLVRHLARVMFDRRG